MPGLLARINQLEGRLEKTLSPLTNGNIMNGNITNGNITPAHVPVTAGFSAMGYVQSSGFSLLDSAAKMNVQVESMTEDGVLNLNRHRLDHLIRIIPPRPYVEIIVETYFHEYNILTEILQQHVFTLAYPSLFSTPPEKRTVEMYYLASLLLRVLSIGILYILPANANFIMQLCPHTDFETLATEYHQTANEMTFKLPRVTEIGVLRVQELILSAHWLKDAGEVIEAWHVIGRAIREAQEMQMHLEPPPEEREEKEQWRTLWWAVYRWDRGITYMLGRPSMINDSDCTLELPKELSQAYSDEVPSMSTARNLSNKLIYLVSTRGFSLSTLDGFSSTIPPIFSLINPDKTWDSTMPNLAKLRIYFHTLVLSQYLAIYRRSLATSQLSPHLVPACSRSIAACIEMINMYLQHHHRHFSLSLCLFEAAATLCSAILLFPNSLNKTAALHDVDLCLAKLDELKPMNVLARRGSLLLNALKSRCLQVG